MATSIYQSRSNAYRQYSGTPIQTQPPQITPVDDYEKWYTDPGISNRMVLSLRSGLEDEVAWALDRLLRLSDNEQGVLHHLPGIIDALYELALWYVSEGYQEYSKASSSLFAAPQDLDRRRRFSLEALFILRHGAIHHEQSSLELRRHSQTIPFILNCLHNLDAEADENTEIVLHTVDLLQSVSEGLILPPPQYHSRGLPLVPLQNIVATSRNRALIISAMTALSLLLSTPQNSGHFSADAPYIGACIRYMPLFKDEPFMDANLNLLYVHLSSPSMAKAFLLHPEMPSLLRVLVSYLLHDQKAETIEVSLGEGGPNPFASSNPPAIQYYSLTEQELAHLLTMKEPERCFQWMTWTFISNPNGEVSQVDFWNMYRETFTPYADKHVMLPATEVIKNVNAVFPNAHAKVILDADNQRFVVRGVEKRKATDLEGGLAYVCQWPRSQCTSQGFGSFEEFDKHLQEHVNSIAEDESPCLWSTCNKPAMPKHVLRAHVLTHTPRERPSPPSDSLNPRQTQTQLTYETPAGDPPSSGLTALLCIRVLFKISFASSDSAPRVDADHFGFPGFVDVDMAELDTIADTEVPLETDRTGQQRGKKAFVAVRKLMESVKIRDEVLMSWIEEMIEAGITGVYE